MLSEQWAKRVQALESLAMRALGAVNALILGGDVTGLVTNNTVVRVRGTTVGTAGGALPVGVVLRTTGVASADWGPLDLADPDAVTGALPSTNQAHGFEVALRMGLVQP